VGASKGKLLVQEDNSLNEVLGKKAEEKGYKNNSSVVSQQILCLQVSRCEFALEQIIFNTKL